MDGEDEPSDESELLDVSSMPLAELISSTDSVLDNALRYVLDEAARSQEAISGWSSYVE